MAASTSAGKTRRAITMGTAIVLGAGFAYVLGYILGRSGDWLIYGLASLAVTPILVALIARLVEHTSLLQVFDPTAASWMFLFGDVALAFMGAFLTLNIRDHAYGDQWFNSLWFLACCYALGLAVGFGFREVIDKGAWVEQHTLRRFDAPSKFYHDLTVYPSLFAANIFLAVPAIFYTNWLQALWPWLAAGTFLIWALLFIHDAKGLNTWQLHGIFDYDAVRPAYPAGWQRPGELTFAQVKAAKATAHP